MQYEKFREKLYGKYAKAAETVCPETSMTIGEFDRRIGKRLSEMESVTAQESDGKNGILFYSLWDDDGCQVCEVPVFGYYGQSEKVLTRLFCALADRALKSGSTLFQIHLYANDEAALRQFSRMQFGYMAETGLCRAEAVCPKTDYTIRTLDKAEITGCWSEIWVMTEAILSHLRQAPIFYPCTEFTEAVYRDFFLDEETRLHAAFDADGHMVGMIETNSEPNPMVSGKVRSVNIGEVYVPADKRGTGLSHDLFSYAMAYEQERGAEYLWVTHGTANPNASGFWGRYFQSYEYELNRKIEI